MPEPLRCRHIHTEGRQCGSPALRGEKLCFYHHTSRRPQPAHPGTVSLPSFPDPEDLHAVQRGLAELLHLVARELIDAKQAKRLFAILAQAGTNLARIDRQNARTRELDLRARALALAEARHPASTPGQPPNSIDDPLVTEPIYDPILGPLAPGPEPGLHPHSSPEALAAPRTISPSIEPQPIPQPISQPIPQPVPAQPTRARLAELDAEAAAEAEFQRREEEYREERRSVRQAAQEVMYNLLTPQARLREDARRAAAQAEYDHPAPAPELASGREIYPYPL